MLTNFIRNQIGFTPLSPRTEEGKAVAFSHFRYDMDYDDEVPTDSVEPFEFSNFLCLRLFTVTRSK